MGRQRAGGGTLGAGAPPLHTKKKKKMGHFRWENS